MQDQAGFHVVYDEKVLEQFLKDADNQGYFAVDTETNSLNSMEAELVGVSLAINENEAYYVPIGHKNKEDVNLKKQLSLQKVIKILKPYLEDETIKKIGQNIKYDLKIFLKYGIQINSIEDTMLLSYTLDSVTFPLMAPISIGAIIIRLIEASKIMDTVYVLTSGGPGTSTETSSFYIFIKGLREFQMGYAASMSFTYLIIMIISLTIIAKVLTKLLLKE